jgi:predicted ester cyclase
MTDKEAARLIVTEAFSKGNLDILDEVLGPDFFNHNAPPGIDTGIEGVKQIIRMERAGIPDMTCEMLHEAQEGDIVFQHVRITGTHSGPLFGVQGTGREVHWREMHVARMAGGRCVEHWGVTDMAGLWVQIGRATPPRVSVPAATGAR